MHFEEPKATASPSGPLHWYQGLTPYMWFVFVVASLGWLFDTMDQQLFNLARKPAVTSLIKNSVSAQALRQKVDAEQPPEKREAVFGKAYNDLVDEYSGHATSIFMIGWALGGIFFGIMGDKVGRARTMLLTVLTYSCFTGLSALSRGVWDFAFYRFLTGLGVGGQFAVGVAMVAEVMPDRARPKALGMLQALSAVGNMLAGLTGLVLSQLQRSGAVTEYWRTMFVIGLAPAVLAIPIMSRLKEPERWKSAVHEDDAAGAWTPQAQAWVRPRAFLGSPLAAEHALRHAPGFFRGRRALGHRRVLE